MHLQYESEMNGLRTAAAMRESVRQGFYPGGLTPDGFCKVPVEVRAGKKPRYKLAVEPREAEILRTMHRPYITGSGALKIAGGAQCTRLLHAEANLWARVPSSRLSSCQSAAGGVVRWGVHDRGKLQTPDQWIIGYPWRPSSTPGRTRS